MARLILLLVCWPVLVWAEGVDNVRFAAEGDQVRVFYDLEGEGRYAVELWLSHDGGHVFDFQARAVVGHIGQEVQPGTAREVRWDVLTDVPAGLEGDGFVFEIRARRPGSGPNPLVLGVAGVAAVGVTGALVLGDDKPQRGRILIDVPDPEE